MLLIIAALLLHPQFAPKTSLVTGSSDLETSAALTNESDVLDAENSLPMAPVSPAPLDIASQPVNESNAALPDAPVTLLTAPAPIAFIKPATPLSVTVSQLAAENRRKQIVWKGLAIAASGAATFDAWSTRHAITTYGAQELNPLLRPFAGNTSLYAAVQVAPLLMDFVGRKMMYSGHSWMRRTWWVPQSASFVSSLFCGAHNLTVR